MLLALVVPLLPSVARPAVPPTEAQAFADRVLSAWTARQLDGWLALWEFASPDARAAEEAEARLAFEADETVMTTVRPPTLSADGERITVDVQVFVADEPHGRVGYWRLVAERRAAGFALVRRSLEGEVDGLVHLALAPEAWHARDLQLRFEDFELLLQDGVLYATSEDVGRTALVFVGRGSARFQPRPASEREQLRQFSGAPTLDTTIDWAYVRIPPAAFEGLVQGAKLLPAVDSPARRAAAERVFQERAPRSYMLDTPLHRSPWWLNPGAGDAVIDFPWRRGRVLTYARAANESEDVNLFERDRHLQVCSYGSPSRSTAAEDERRAVDVLDQELLVRFEPERRELVGVHAMRVRPLAGNPTMRLRLDDDLRVSSVTTADGTSLLFFRIREQGAIVVSLGALGAGSEPVTLVTRYAGRHDPLEVDQEVLQVQDTRFADEDSAYFTEPPLVYSNRTAWYPRTPTEDFATATVRFDTPAGWLAVTGGEQRELRTEERRTRSQYRLEQPGKYVTAIVGRLSDMGLRQLEAQSVRGYGTARTKSDTVEQMVLAEEMLAFYARLFGPCPYPSLGLVLAQGKTPGGHSPPGLVYVQERPAMLRPLADDPANFADLPGYFLAHELAHQWWGQGTAPASYRERWLSEAWAQYAAALWVRERLGESAFHRMMDRMASWAFRFDPEGPIHLGQRLGSLRQEPRVFRAVVYDKGAWVLHMLRGILGDEAFFAGARAFLEKRRYAKASSDDLRLALEGASGRDLRPYFARWIEDTGLPRLRWSAHTRAQAPGFRTTLTVRVDGLPGPVPLLVTLGGDSGDRDREERIQLPPGGDSWSFETAARPRVALNEDRGLLARIERTSR